MNESNTMPKFLVGLGSISCSYAIECKARALCDRTKDDIVAVKLPIPENENNMLGVAADLRLAMKEWGNIPEEECTREDNFTDGEPVTVFRQGNYAERFIF